MMFHSEYHPYSYGIVASVKDDDNQIEVVPIEVLPTTDAVIDITPKTYAVSGVDRFGNPYEAETEYSDTIPARWISFEYNRMSAPDIHPGETVMLYQFSDLQQFFWVPMKNKSEFRSLEHVVYAFSAKPEPDGMELDGDNAYVLMVSTRDGFVRFTTSDANGEPIRYVIEINTKDGKFGFVDSRGNQMYVDSLASLIELINEKQSKIRMDEEHIEVIAPQTISLLAGTDIIMDAGRDMIINVADNATTKVGNNIKTTSGKNTTNKAGGRISSKSDSDHIIDGSKILIG